MEIIKNRKGYVRLVEVSVAAALVFGFLIFVQQTQTSLSGRAQSYDSVVLKTLGEDTLRSLDLRDADNNFHNDLRDYVVAGNWARASQEISASLPQNIGFTLYNIDAGGTPTYKGGTAVGAQPTKREIVSVNYIVAADNGTYCSSGTSCNIKLALWFRQ